MDMRKLRNVALFTLFAALLTNSSLADQFDPVQATNTYLQSVAADEIANTNGYVDAGYRLMAIEPLLELLIAFLLLHFGLSRKWRDLAERRLKSPFLQAFKDNISVLQVFVHQVRSGKLAVNEGKILSRSVDDYLRAVAQTFLAMGTKDPA